MKRVLIVSPRFAPSNGADTHRVRFSLPYFQEFGWQPTVLSVDPDVVEGSQDPILSQTIPPEIEITRVNAVRPETARKVGIGDLALRALPYLYSAGSRLIRNGDFALAYFSTTAFPALVLGRLWKQKFGLPFVVDMQDPWLSDYYDDKPRNARPPKYWFAHKLHGAFEPWTMKAVDGLVSVSAQYLTTLNRRYPWLVKRPQVVLPFGASEIDVDIARRNPHPNRFFQKGDGHLNGVYVGRGGQDMTFALRVMFGALKAGIEKRRELFDNVKLHFIGTDYAVGNRARPTIQPIAEELGVSPYIQETTERVPYFEALQLLRDADFLIVPGSDDPQYTASKIYPYILAARPLLAVFNQESSVCGVLNDTRAGEVVAFDASRTPIDYVPRFLERWSELLLKLPFVPAVNREAFKPYTAREMTGRQCALFEQVLSGSIAQSTARETIEPVPLNLEKTCSN